MPQRTNEKQEIIALLRRNLANEGCAVTESKMLKDSVSGLEREVDVVMDCTEGDVSITISFEVLAHSRPADVTWVQAQLKKHETLPTNKLYLVSWSGFTGGAVRQAATDPKVVLVAPEIVTDAQGQQAIRSLFVDEVELNARAVSLFIDRPGSGVLKSTGFMPDHMLFDEAGQEVGQLHELVSTFLASPIAGSEVGEALHNHPEREKVTHFVLGANPIPNLNLFVRWDATAELHSVVGLEVRGEASWKQTRVDLAVAKFGDVQFGHARTEIQKRAAMIVATLGDAETIKRVTTRVYGEGKAP